MNLKLEAAIKGKTRADVAEALREMAGFIASDVWSGATRGGDRFTTNFALSTLPQLPPASPLSVQQVVPALPLFRLSAKELQHKFGTSRVLAEKLHKQLQDIALPSRPGVTFFDHEDEMLTFHHGGRYYATVYTAGPEYARKIAAWLRQQGKIKTPSPT